jgi:hypothetical protein
VGIVSNFEEQLAHIHYDRYKAFHEFPPAGGISIRGNLYTLSDRETPAAFLRKQVDIGTIWSTHLTEFKPTSTRHEAGLTIFLSIQFHNEIGVTLNPVTQQPTIFASTRTGEFANLTTVYADLPRGAEKDGVKLFIKAEAQGYSLGYGSANGKEAPTYIASVENKWLQSFVPGCADILLLCHSKVVTLLQMAELRWLSLWILRLGKRTVDAAESGMLSLLWINAVC